MKNKLQRPALEKIISATAFRQWYWLKAELIHYCQQKRIPSGGSKQELEERIAHYITTGNVLPISRHLPTSTFNWAREHLTLDTVITDSYTSGPNVRRFMKGHVGERFRFTIDFMKWMNENAGQTLGEAVKAWQRLEEKKQEPNFRTTIPHQNQYNRYLRDFFTDNPDQNIATARRCWKLKRSLPGTNHYEPSDLLLKEDG